MQLTFEATPDCHERIERWVDRQQFVGTCSLTTPLHPSGIDCRRDAVLTRSTQRARALSVRKIDFGNDDDAMIFKATFQRGAGDFRVISRD